LSEYLLFHQEASAVRSSLLLQSNQVVAIYDARSDTILGGSVDQVLLALTGDSLCRSALCSAGLEALANLDRQVSQQIYPSTKKPENTVIVVGSGGREHAIAVALAKSPLVDKVICCPGNGGTQQEGGKISNQGSSQDNDTVIHLVKESSASMVVVGPEGPLVDGLVDRLATECPHVRAFGPTRAAAQLEASKVCQENFPNRLR
jgi:Phosphoribosylglycinamide synthetase, N domain